MKIVTNPTVYLIGTQQVRREQLDHFLRDLGVEWESDSANAGEVIAEVSGRICYLSFATPRPGGNAAYLRHILEVGHGSVLEHAVYNLVVTGVSRSLSHELVRHRAGVGVSQLSQRYVDESVAEYVEPVVIAADPELHAIWLDAVGHAHAAYVKLSNRLLVKLQAEPCPVCGTLFHDVGNWCRSCERYTRDPSPPHRTEMRKAARQAARSVLPNATETKLSLTVNARSARNIIEQRCSRHAEPEIRVLAGMIWETLVAEAPSLFGDYTKVPLPDGTYELITPYRKV